MLLEKSILNAIYELRSLKTIVGSMDEGPDRKQFLSDAIDEIVYNLELSVSEDLEYVSDEYRFIASRLEGC